MLKTLELRNFRCFGRHRIDLRPTSVLVGSNNAGKSTLAEALRLIALVVSRYRALPYRRAPAWTKYGMRTRGVSPSADGLGINFETVFHRYAEPPAEILATFENGTTVELLIGPEAELFAVIEGKEKGKVTSKGGAQQLDIPEVAILPQVSSLVKEERILGFEYVRKSQGSHLSSSHFRNQLFFFDDFFEDFKDIAERTWPHMRVLELEGERDEFGRGTLSLLIRDSDFVAEVGWMGHGLQMWLQMCWFLARSSSAKTIILDEPDVYLHADLQRKLIRMLSDLPSQVIIATHSLEIIGAVEPEDILVVDKRKRRSRFATSLPAVQRVVDQLGAVHNLQLTRLWSAKRCLLLEGDDIALLGKLHTTLFPSSTKTLDSIPHLSIGGWSGWNYAIGSGMLLKNAGGGEILVYCLLDRDFHIPSEIASRQREARRRGISLHIWKRKELENYLLLPEAIARTVKKRVRRGAPRPTVKAVKEKILSIAEKLKTSVNDAVAEHFLAANRGGGFTQASRRARDHLSSRWQTREDGLSLASGKKILSILSGWSQETFQVSFSPLAIAREARAAEIPNEVVEVLSRIDSGEQLKGIRG